MLSSSLFFVLGPNLKPHLQYLTASKAYIPVPSMLPRPLLTSTFALTYRKIPVLAIGRDLYCDTSLIIEALEHFFPATQGWGSVYPQFEGLDEWIYKGLVRGFASFWTDVSNWIDAEKQGLTGTVEAFIQNNNRPNPEHSLVLALRHRPRPTNRPHPRPLKTPRQNSPEPRYSRHPPQPPGAHVQEARRMGYTHRNAVAR